MMGALQVLVVEDSRFFASVLRKGIEEKLGYAIALAGSRAEAQTILAERRQDFFAALVDLHLPDSTEGEVVDDTVAAGLPTIVFTAAFDDELRELVLAKHVVDYVTKNNPTSIQQVLSTLRRLAVNGETQVLVVDDSRISRRVIGDQLRAHRFQVIEAADGAEALAILDKTPSIRLGIIDYNMANMDGCTLVTEIRRRYSRDQMVLIGISAHGSNLLSARFMKAGASDYINKPFIPEELFCRIYQNLDLLDHIADLNRQRAEREALEDSLRQAVQDAQQANHAKSQFLSSMSHELRTPLNAILGFAQMLDYNPAQPLTPAQHTCVTHILQGGQHLLTLIGEILDLAKIETGQFQLSLEPVPLSDALAECRSLMQPLAERLGITLSVSSQPGLVLHADYTRLKQVILNLLSNAIKYNRPNGQVWVDCRPDHGGMVTISVADTGNGIDESRVGDLFKPFTRLGQENSRIEGTGIGLTITKQLTERMGGTIRLDNQPGEGCTFFISLPAAASPIQSVNPATISPVTRIAPWPVRVLYVEDNPANIELMQMVFSRLPEACLITANDGRTGLERAVAERPDLIILDLNLPDLSGYQVLERLQHLPETSAIPALALTAAATRDDHDRALGAGFRAYLTKPFQIDRLIAALRLAVETK